MFKEKVILLDPYQFLSKLAEVIVDYAKEKELNISKFLVILPNRRSGIYLRYFIAKKLCNTTYSPGIFSIDDFVDEFYEKFVRKDIKLSFWDGQYILFKEFEKFKIFTNFWDFVYFGARIYTDFEELKLFDIDSMSLKNHLLSYDIPEESRIGKILQVLPEVYHGFYEYLDKEGYSTRATRYLKLSEVLGPSFFNEEIVLWNPPIILSKAEKILLENLLKYNKFHLVLQNSKFIIDEYKDLLKSLGYEISENTEQFPIRFNGKIHDISTEDDISEVLILKDILNSIEDLTGVEDPLKVGIVLPDPSKLIPVLDVGLPPSLKEYNVSMGYPVKFTAYYSFLKDFWDLVSFSHVSKENILLNVSKLIHFLERDLVYRGSSNIFEDFLSFLKSLLDKGFTYLDPTNYLELAQKFGFSPEAISHVFNDLYTGFLKTFFSSVNLRDFLDNLIDFYSSNEKFNFSLRFKTPLKGVEEKVIQELVAMRNSKISTVSSNGNDPLENIKDYLNFTRSALGATTIPLKGTPLKGLQILGLLESRLLSFDKLIILDVQDGLVSNIMQEDTPIIPYRVKKDLGLFDFKKREKISEALFFTLIESAQEITLIYKNTESFEPSHYLLLLKEFLRNESITPIHVTYYSNETISFTSKPAFEKGIKKSPDLIDSLKQLKFSYSALETYLTCPVKFYFTYVLQIKPEIEDEFDRLKIGTVIHKILQEFFKLKENEEITSETDLRNLSEVAEQVLREEYPVDTPRVKILKEGIKKRLEIVLKNIQKEIKKTIKDEFKNEQIIFIRYLVEQEAGTQINFGGIPINFTGKIDRIDIYNRFINIIDYKSSANVKEYGRGADITNLQLSLNSSDFVFRTMPRLKIQLPVYFWLFSKDENLKSQVKAILGHDIPDSIFVTVTPLKKLTPEIQVKRYSFSGNELQVVEGFLKKVIFEILNSEVPFYMPDKKRRGQICEYCDFRGVCGI
ncbi:MAG: PD-(D/E)XK nuclease family protein [Candidatus Hydrothermia bacterium]